ncbi:MAG: S41 family peptidase [Acidobacteria bacterium]|nr:S41 family peptidase [Acidobacteriota bacterium]MCI0723172.1 S41 family peptidase [Acidobacteriota bacterium]
MTLTQTERAEILKNVTRIVEEKHFNPNRNQTDWKRLVEAETPRILSAETAESFEAAMQRLITQLGSSHTAFFHESGESVPARYAINATFHQFETHRGLRWVFQDVLEGGPAHSSGLKPGEILLTVSSQEVRPPGNPTFGMGAGHELTVEGLDGQDRTVTVEIPKQQAKDRPPMVEPRSVAHSVVDDIALLKVTVFPGDAGAKFARELDAAVAEIKRQKCSRLIVDLRANIGGGLGALRLMSYLTPDRIPIGHSLTKQRAEKGYRKESLTRIGKIPSSKAGLIWMGIRFRYIQKDRSMVLVTEGLGPQPFHGKTVLLVNESTNSAGEMVAAFTAENRLATIVGTRTAGAVLGGANFRVGNGYRFRLPITGWFTWQGNTLEGKGVSPDVPIEVSYEALRVGKDRQLEKAIEVVRNL